MWSAPCGHGRCEYPPNFPQGRQSWFSACSLVVPNTHRIPVGRESAVGLERILWECLLFPESADGAAHPDVWAEQLALQFLFFCAAQALPSIVRLIPCTPLVFLLRLGTRLSSLHVSSRNRSDCWNAIGWCTRLGSFCMCKGRQCSGSLCAFQNSPGREAQEHFVLIEICEQLPSIKHMHIVKMRAIFRKLNLICKGCFAASWSLAPHHGAHHARWWFLMHQTFSH